MPFFTSADTSEEVPLLPEAARVCRWIYGIAAGVAILIGFSNLIPWFINRPIAGGFMVMRFNTALAITAAGISLALWYGQAGRTRRLMAKMFGLFAALIGGLSSVQDLFAIDLGIDQLFRPGTFPGDMAERLTVRPGRMSLNAALSLFFLGASLMALDTVIPIGKRRIYLSPPLAILGALPAALGLVGYLLGVSTFTGILRSTSVLFHTAAALLLLSISALTIRPDRPPLRRVLSTGAEGLLLRWTLPGTLALLLALGWLINQGRRIGWVAPGEGTALMLYGGIVLLTGLLITASRAVAGQEARARRAALALRAGQERSRAIIDTALDAVVLMDSAGLIVAWNPAAERMFGWCADEAVGQVLADRIIPERLRSAHTRGLANYMETGEAPVFSRRLELPALRRDGTEFPVELSINPLPDSERALFVGFIRDITERKAAEENLRAAKDAAESASRAKDNFLATLSHELRTPLAPVLMSTASMREDDRLPLEVRAQIAMIERNIALEARLIDDMLDLTRIARGKLPLRTEHCDAHSLLSHAVEIVRDEARAKKVALDVELSARHSGLRGDPARLQQVFWNLLKNAVKFTPPGGSIKIKTHETAGGDRLVLEVVDTGVGFAPDVSARLFEPFEQAGREGDHRFGGLGLGLSIARAIVDLHGGKIYAGSPGAGQGATFTVELPGPCEPPSGIMRLNPTPAGDDEMAPLRLLVVEDHEPTLSVLTRLLGRAGHDVVPAGNVATALAAAESTSFDAVISDLGLPDGTGLELIAKLRAREPRLRGIALSGYGMEEDLVSSRDAGFTMHLVKPVEFDQLRQALRQVMRAGEPVGNP